MASRIRTACLILGLLAGPATGLRAQHDPVTPDAAASATLSTCLGVRVLPLAESLRLVFQFDRSAPYVIRMDPSGQKAYLDILQARLDYLPAGVNRLDDPRLEGIWIQRLDPGLITLELRLASPAVRLTHFALTTPPTIVIDLTRSDGQAIPIGGAPLVASHAPAMPLIQPSGAVLPRAALDGPPPDPHAEPAADDPPTTAPHAVTAVQPNPEALAARAEDYDGFPIESLAVQSALAVAIHEDFLFRRWGAVLNKSLQYLKNNPVDPEAIAVIYMMAEARWQLGHQDADPPMAELQNFYRQAIQTQASGPLGAFGHWRLAQAADRTGDRAEALYHCAQALPGTPPPQRWREEQFQAGLLADTGQVAAALRLLASQAAQPLPAPLAVERAKQEARIRLAAGDAPGAWRAFQDASALDPAWMHLDLATWETLAVTAQQVGEADQALAWVQELLRNYAYRDQSENYRLLLLRGRLLEQLGEQQTAEETYQTVLQKLRQTIPGAEIHRQALDRFPAEVMESEGRFCMMLWRKGQTREAMAELNRIYQLCIREGIEPRPIQPVIEVIVPDYMQEAIERNSPSETVQAWVRYEHLIQNPQRREAAERPLVQALENLGLFDAAGRLHERLGEAGRDAVWTLDAARLRLESGDREGALAILEHPLPSPVTPAHRLEAEILLAKAYAQSDRPLQAAQAWQAVAESPLVDDTRRAEAFLAAGEGFLGAGMANQTIELGVKALFFESNRHDAGVQAWPPETALALRLMLARAYAGHEEDERAAILLEDILTRQPAPEPRAQTRLLLAASRRRLGQLDQARDAWQAAVDDPETPELYRDQARTALQMIQWNDDHPQWPVFTAAPTDPTPDPKGTPQS